MMNYFPISESDDESRRVHFGPTDNPNIPNLHGAWDSLGISVPTISAYAYMCAQALFNQHKREPSSVVPNLTGPAKAILFLGQRSGAFEVKVMPRGFRTTERFLALHIHISDEESIVFQDANDLRVAIEFLNAFRELCLAGLCLHQLHGEFSLSQHGFEIAHTIQHSEVQPWLNKAQNINGI